MKSRPLFDVIPIVESKGKELVEISRKLNLGLSIEEMERIQEYFRKEARNPSDVEIQAIAQAWSEHCSYKSSKIYLKKYLFGIAEDKVISRGDAGLVSIDDQTAVVFKIESHNHPSAIEPYGGAATGVGGILRDVLSMGAQPIAVTDVLYFGTKKTKGFQSPKFIENGVIAGIRDYGNRVGIPTVAGGIFYSDYFSPNVLVNVGCVGTVDKNKAVSSKISDPSISLIIAGGKTGRDGIHGVNMASMVMRAGEEDATTVQLGSPITKEPLIHAILEARDRGLLYALKDLGGGGLSSVVGEMLLSGRVGGKIYLDKVPLKEEKILPWEIWISESQERMLLAVRKANVNPVLKIMEDWDISAAVIGESEVGNRLKILFNGAKVLDLQLDFMTSPRMLERPATSFRLPAKTSLPKYQRKIDGMLLKMLSNNNIRTKEFAVRQYDHTVRGNTVVGPFSGIIGREGPTDASVIRYSWDKESAIAITHGSNPYYAKSNSYLGGINAVDEAVRNLISVGAEPIGFSDCLNSGNPEDPEVMGELINLLRGLSDGASTLQIPFVSGNVSFYNESGHKRIPTLATILSVGKVNDYRKSITPDFKRVGNPIYMIGMPTTEMGGSLYYRLLGLVGGEVPYSDPRILKRRGWNLLKSIESGLVESVHDVSEGGMGIAIPEMTIGSNIGALIDLSSLAVRPDFAVFSEPQSTWIVEVKAEKEDSFVETMGGEATKLGITQNSMLSISNGNENVVSLPVDKILNYWKKGYS